MHRLDRQCKWPGRCKIDVPTQMEAFEIPIGPLQDPNPEPFQGQEDGSSPWVQYIHTSASPSFPHPRVPLWHDTSSAGEPPVFAQKINKNWPKSLQMHTVHTRCLLHLRTFLGEASQNQARQRGLAPTSTIVCVCVCDCVRLTILV